MAAKAALLLLFAASAAAAMLLSPATVAAADDGLTTFKVYWHDVYGGTSPTAIRIAQAASTSKSSSSFGAVVAIDDPLTTTSAVTGSARSKDEVGRAQGTYTFADQSTIGCLMNMNFVFTAGDHKGSGLTIFGRNAVLTPVREMSIVGGTGKFRMATGYVEARTISNDNGETVVEYTVHVKPAAAATA